MRDDGDFLKDLRSEIHSAQERRAAYTRQKFAFVTGFLGIGSISIQHLGTMPLLYIAPIVAIAYDLYILGENFGIRRAGAFILKSEKSPKEEKLWEKAVRANRDLFAKIGGPLSTLLVLFAAGTVLFPSQRLYPHFWTWTGVTLLIMYIVSWLDRTRHNELKKFEEFIDKERKGEEAQPVIGQANQAEGSKSVRGEGAMVPADVA
jgi:hypothetical protein